MQRGQLPVARNVHIGNVLNYSKVHNDGPVQLSVVYTIVLTSVTQIGLPRFAAISQTFSRDTKRDLTLPSRG